MQLILITVTAAAKLTTDLTMSHAHGRLLWFLKKDNIKEVLYELSGS